MIMEWFNLPEDTTEERAKKEIAECEHCLSSLLSTMRKMKVPQAQWGENVMVKAYVERINKAKMLLCKNCA